ncbi:hypothetical protein ALTERO38_50925 [Alteromonas sp. 38]|nr:hypothetical protein ALTER154_70107 [Alteromonas sp. 154]VXB53700.1 hypothetical protein ALTERO38_50925 [Alteromonas sp. 38]
MPSIGEPLPIAQSVNYLKYRPDVASAERNLGANNARTGVALPTFD